MAIVAGHIIVAPQQRESYLAGCVSIVEQAPATQAASASRSPPTWSTPVASTSSSAGSRKRRSKPSAAAVRATSKSAEMLSASVAEYDVADVRPLSGGDTA